MPRVYKRSKGARKYADYDSNVLQAAVNEVKSGKSTAYAAEKKYNISRMTIIRKVKGMNSLSYGGQTILTAEEEDMLVQYLLTCAEWGFSLTMREVRYLVKSYLDECSQTTRFKDNLPGYDWSVLFLKRHRKLSHRIVVSQKPSRAKVSPEEIEGFFRHLSVSLKDVPAENVINYDESAFVDTAGDDKVVVRRGSKYPCLIRDSKKTSVSVMFSVTVSGFMLPPYTVYKSECLWNTWVMESLHGSRFNRSKSGWFDMAIFEDWFLKVAYPYLRRLPGKKVMIGDNLASHLSYRVIRTCEATNISFVLLPPNATHLLQPLDVAVFRPIKLKWKKVMRKHKQKKDEGNFKENFPRVLKKTVDEIGKRNAVNIRSGFRACGIVPLNGEVVLKKLPRLTSETSSHNSSRESVLHSSLVKLLQQERFVKVPTRTGRRKKLNVAPGKSISAQDLENPDHENSDSNDSDDWLVDDVIEEAVDDVEEAVDDVVEEAVEDVVEEAVSGDFSEMISTTSTPSTSRRTSRHTSSNTSTSTSGQVPTLVLSEFVVVKYMYAQGEGERGRFYLGQIRRIFTDTDEVEIHFLRKYMNRSNEFVFVIS